MTRCLRSLTIVFATTLAACGPWDDFARSIEGDWRTCPDTRAAGEECLPSAPTCIEEAFAGCVQTRTVHAFETGGHEAIQHVFVYPQDAGCKVTLFEDHSRSGLTADQKPRVFDCSRLGRDGCGHYTGLDCTPR